MRGSTLISIDCEGKSVSEDQDRLVAQITRYGLPAIILIFYITASLNFQYTPDSTFLMLREGGDTGSTTPAPLWMLLIAVGKLMGVDGLLVAKALGLFCGCAAILAMFVLAQQFLQDRLLALTVALMMAMQFWLLQTSVTGSALNVAMVLVLMAVVFLLKNDYMAATVMIGLCSLVFWQAALFLPVVFYDLMVNSISRRRGIKVFLAGILVYAAVLLPWFLFALLYERGFIPALPPVREFPATDSAWIALIVFLVVLLGSGVVVLVRRPGGERIRLHSYIPPLLVTGILMLGQDTGNLDLTFLALPLLMAMAVDAGKVVLGALGHQNKVHLFALALTAVVLIQSQLFYLRETRPLMAKRQAESTELARIGDWLGSNLQPGDVVAAEHPGIVGYHAGWNVVDIGSAGSGPTYLVSSGGDHPGYVRAFSAGMQNPDLHLSANHFAVWRRE